MERYIERAEYMSMLWAGKDLPDVVKVVTGMRRAGKSTLLKMYIDRLRSSGILGKDIIWMNMETFEYSNVRDHEALDVILKEAIGQTGTKYVFIDEIQNVAGWEMTISSLVNTGRCDIYITGSNSKMLSSELTTHIAGRFVEVPILPLSFGEYLELHPGDREERFDQFIRYGSLPEVDPGRGEMFCDSQLRGIFNTVLVEDVLSRMGSGDATTLLSIARFLYTNIGNETNTDSIAKALKISNDTAKRYVSVMTGAFLFYNSEKYDIVGKKVLKTNGKYYASDMGLRRVALMGAGMSDISRPLENIVYLELVRRGYTVRTGSFRDSEVDFTATKGDRTEYYQVCQTMMSDDTRHREFRPLKGIRDNYRKTVLTLDRFGLGNEEGIEIVNILDWLCGR